MTNISHHPRFEQSKEKQLWYLLKRYSASSLHVRVRGLNWQGLKEKKEKSVSKSRPHMHTNLILV